MEEYYFLFKDMEKFNGEFDYSVEIVDALLDNRIDTSKEFKLFGYCKAIRNSRQQAEYKKAEKEKSLDDEDSKWEEAASLYNHVDVYGQCDENDELASTICAVREYRMEIMAETGLDLVWCLRQAVRGIPAAAKELAKFCGEYKKYAEYVKTILGCGIPFEELFPDAMETPGSDRKSG